MCARGCCRPIPQILTRHQIPPYKNCPSFHSHTFSTSSFHSLLEDLHMGGHDGLGQELCVGWEKHYEAEGIHNFLSK